MSAARQLALWIGRRGKGSARLQWGGKELTLFVEGLQILAVEGDDGERLAAGFGLPSEGEWFRQAGDAVAGGLASQGEANAVVKRAVAERLRAFFLAPDAEVAFDSGLPVEPEGLTLSYPHIIVEMVLGTGGEELVPVFLPDPDLVLHRLPEFARRVGALGLTDEALAVFAKINDTRTAREIAEPSPHGSDLVKRLVAAAVGAGLVDSMPPIAQVMLPSPEEEEAHPTQVSGRRWWWAVVALVVLAAAVAVVALLQPWRSRSLPGAGGPWGVAVDRGCQPAEVEQLYRRQERDRTNLRVVPIGAGAEQCYSLVWGHFPDQAAADRAARALPDGVLKRGFPPHPVLVSQER